MCLGIILCTYVIICITYCVYTPYMGRVVCEHIIIYIIYASKCIYTKRFEFTRRTCMLFYIGTCIIVYTIMGIYSLYGIIATSIRAFR